MNGKIKNASTWVPVIIAVSFVAGMLTARIFNDKSVTGGNEKLDNIMSLIDQYYVDDVDMDSLVELAIPSLLANLDPHSTYIPASDLQSVNDELEGSFGGIGITFQMMNDTVTVLEVISGGPAEKVGMLPGDRIVTINDSVAAGRKWSNEKILKTLRGEKGTKVKLGVKRSTAATLLPFTVTRGDIPVTSIDAAYTITPGVGYVKVNKFGRNTFQEFLTEITKLKGQGVGKYVIDLRGNGGGYMEPAILMANEFLPADRLIVSTKGRNMDNNTSIASDGTGSFSDAEVVVILDEYSASASEIFAGAIQDNDRGLIVGRRSFGKGLVQHQELLPDNSAIRLTVARYYTPSGRCIQKTYRPGEASKYSSELFDRYSNGELYSADSIKIDKSLSFLTSTGRTVYGGGGIIPDLFVPNDTTGISSYYISVANAGLLQKFAFEYCDLNRDQLSKCKTADQILKILPPDDILLQSFADFAADNGVPARWIYINISRDLIVNQLKALISRDILGTSSYFYIYNRRDPSVLRAVKALQGGESRFPIVPLRAK